MIGAGKSTAAEYLSSTYKAEHRSFVKTIWEPILLERGLEITRPNLQELGIELMEERGANGLVDDMFGTLGSDGAYLIDDVRSPSVFEYILSISPESKLIFMQTSFDARFPRLQVRDQVASVADQRAAEQMSTETEIADLISYAWRVIENDGTQAELEAQLDEAALALGLEPR